MALRTTNLSFYDGFINKIQNNFQELTRLQTQLTTQKIFEKPSESPVRANQAILMDKNLSDISQYKRNVENGKELLNFSDQISDNVHEQITRAITVSLQALNETTEPEGRLASAYELESILDTLVSIGNSKLGDKSIFAGNNYLETPFQRAGNNILFNGNSNAFNVNVFSGDQIQANISPDKAFGVLQNNLSSERNLDTRIGPLSISPNVKAGTLVLQEGADLRKATLSVTIASGTNTEELVEQINTAVQAKVTTRAADLITAIDAAWVDSGGNAGLGASLAGVIAYTTAADSSEVEAAVRGAAIAFMVPAPVDPTNLTSQEEKKVAAAAIAARNTWAATEFIASKTRGGLNIAHTMGDRVGVDEGASSKNTITDLELAGKATSSRFLYSSALTTDLASDQTLQMIAKDGTTLSVNLYTGDDLNEIVKRINREVNASGTGTAFHQLVARVDSSSVTPALQISSDEYFSIQNVTELTTKNAIGYGSVEASRNRIEDLRSGVGLETGTVTLDNPTVTAPYASAFTIRAGDSLDYIVSQLEDLAGFEASLDSGGEGIELRNVARYSKTLTPTNLAADLTFSRADGSLPTTIDLSSSPNTSLSGMAQAINAASSTNFRFNAEVNTAGTAIVISSNEQFSLNSTDAVMVTSVAQLTDHTVTDLLLESSLINTLGLKGEMDSTGLIAGDSLMTKQVRLSDLNRGQGVDLGKMRISIGTTGPITVDLSSATTLRDVKDIIEASIPGQLIVEMNDDANGIALKSVNGNDILLQEYGSGSTGRHLGLIPAPNNTTTSADIQGSDLDALLSRSTLLKDLNGGTGIDGTGFLIRNGEQETTITFDTNGDGVDNIRTLQELANYINQNSKRDGVFVKASIDEEDGRLKISSMLSNTSLEITEIHTGPSYFTLGGIGIPTAADTLTITDSTGNTSVNVALATTDTLNDIVTKINTAATTAGFSFKAEIGDDGLVEVQSFEKITASSTLSSVYPTAQVTSYFPPTLGSTASDLGLLGAFSDTTLLSTLNGGSGIDHGAFNLTYGAESETVYSVDTIVAPIVAATTQVLTIYNENASLSTTVSIDDTDSVTVIMGKINTAAAAASPAFNFSAILAEGGSAVEITSTEKFSVKNDDTTIDYTTFTDDPGTLAASAKTVVIDLEAASTLGDVKRAIEEATNNEVLVSFGNANRIELSLVNNDPTFGILIEETVDGTDTAHSLGLKKISGIQGRELFDGTTNVLTSNTFLSDLGLSMSNTANSTENDLVFTTTNDAISVDISSANTVGDVVSLINRVTQTDKGNTTALTASIVDGKYLSVKSNFGAPLRVLDSGFSRPAEKLGLIEDPTLNSNAFYISEDLKPEHQADNFFSSLTTLIYQFRTDLPSESIASAAVEKLNRMMSSFLEARAEAGARINRFEALKNRFDEEEIYLEDILASKNTIDIIGTTQRFLAQQQVYEAGLSSASRVLGMSLFSFL